MKCLYCNRTFKTNTSRRYVCKKCTHTTVTCKFCKETKTIKTKPTVKVKPSFCSQECSNNMYSLDNEHDPIYALEHSNFYSLVSLNYRKLNRKDFADQRYFSIKDTDKKMRSCVKCRKVFKSENNGIRICAHCKLSINYNSSRYDN